MFIVSNFKHTFIIIMVKQIQTKIETIKKEHKYILMMIVQQKVLNVKLSKYNKK